jgi:hypothetical protein
MRLTCIVILYNRQKHWLHSQIPLRTRYYTPVRTDATDTVVPLPRSRLSIHRAETVGHRFFLLYERMTFPLLILKLDNSLTGQHLREPCFDLRG